MREIRNRQNALIRLAVKAFNEESEPIDGMVVDNHEVTLGHASCAVSPIGICIYSDRTISLPGQREMEERGHDAHTNIRTTRTDCCLFCGVPVVEDKTEFDGKQMIPA